MISNQDDRLKLSTIEQTFQCRQKQINKLYHYLILINKLVNENVVIQGPRSTGKTSIVKMFMNQFGLFHVWFDAVDLDSGPKFYYEKVLSQIWMQIKKDSCSNINEPAPKSKCQNYLDFLDGLTELFDAYGKLVG